MSLGRSAVSRRDRPGGRHRAPSSRLSGRKAATLCVLGCEAAIWIARERDHGCKAAILGCKAASLFGRQAATHHMR